MEWHAYCNSHESVINRNCYTVYRHKEALLLPVFFVSCTTGVPQGSVLGPTLCTVYISPIAGNAYLHGINQQQYADDTQLFFLLSPSNYRPDLNKLTGSIDALYIWFSINSMALNPDKSEAILLDTRQCPWLLQFLFCQRCWMSDPFGRPHQNS